MPGPAGREIGPVLPASTPARNEPMGSPTNDRCGEPTPPRLPSGDAPATWPVRGSTSASERSSPTCSMNSVPTRRPSSSRGRREISFRTWCFGSTTPSRHQGLSFRVRGPDSPNDEEERSQVRSFPGWLQRHRSAVSVTRPPNTSGPSRLDPVHVQPILGVVGVKGMRPMDGSAVLFSSCSPGP